MKVSFAVAILYYMLCSVHTFNFLPGRIQTNFVRRGRILSVTQQKDVANAVTMPYTLPTAAYKSVVLQSPYNDTYVYQNLSIFPFKWFIFIFYPL